MKKNRMPVLKTEQLKAFYVLYTFGKQTVIKAVNNVDLEVLEDEVFGLAGESGCGKSTLIKALFANINPPLRLFGGRVLYRIKDQEINVTSLRAQEKQKLMWKFISYIPQGSMSILNPVMKIKRTFKDFLESHVGKQARKETLEIAKKHFGELGLSLKVLEYYPHQLSGGMRQRVTVALATLLRPKIILADEPTTALDVVAQRGVIQLLKSLQKRWNSTVVLVTHDMGVHAHIADRIGIMYAGKIVEVATKEQIFKNPLHPYTKFLINSLPRFKDKTIRETIPGNPPLLFNLPSGCPFHPRCPHATELCVRQDPKCIEVEESHKIACWWVDGKNREDS